MTTTSSTLRRFAVKVTAIMSLIALTFPAVAFGQSETIEYYGLDALGSVRAIFNQQGNLVARMDYGPFGENLRAAIKFPTEQFAQLARDAESAQDSAEARNYSAEAGRFNRVDPVYAGLFEPQRWNRYAYVGNNPAGFIDPSGLVEESMVEVPCPAGIQGPCFDGGTVKPDNSWLIWILTFGGWGIGGGSGSSASGDDGAGSSGGWGSSFLTTVGDIVSFTTVTTGSSTPGEDEIVPTPRLATLGRAGTAAAFTAAIIITKRLPTAGSVTLFRTVSAGEMASIRNLGRYAASGSVEGKYFYPTVEQARAFARASYEAGYGPQTLTSVNVPETMLQGATSLRLPGEGTAFFFEATQLPQLGNPTVWKFWPWAGR
jgi:RHS repeat-associated protein